MSAWATTVCTVPSQQRVQAKPSRPRLHLLLLLLHLLTALVLQRGRPRSLMRLHKRRRGKTRALALINDGLADSSTPLPAYLLPVGLLTFENMLVSDDDTKLACGYYVYPHWT